LPSCTCLPGYSGDPFRQCTFKQSERKNPHKINHNHFISLTIHAFKHHLK
jgi:hypothetical protein